MKVAVIGHVEWVDFVSLERFPTRGSVSAAHAAFTHAGGGAVVAAVALLELGAEVDFFCALGRDANGEAAYEELRGRGLGVHAAWRDEPTRRVVTLLERHGPRTIVTIGRRLEPAGGDELPWERLRSAAGAYFTAGDADAATAARGAPVLVATPRARAGLEASAVAIDALVFSAGDADEQAWAQGFEPRAGLMVATEGADGGRWWGETEGRWPAAEPPAEIGDDYGCGDAFAAGFTFGLAGGEDTAAAARLGAATGVSMLARTGAP